MTALIKRYANRKLYNTDTSRYITLKGIAELVEADVEVRVIDNETIVYFVWLTFLDDADEIATVGKVAMVQYESTVFVVRILIQVIDSFRVEKRRSPFDAVH